jgi:transcriptional regulator with XRE-family HTH domain
MIHPRQIKAARALLDWSQDDLAAASGLSVTTVRNLETRSMSLRGTTTNDIRRAIENAGLEFIEPEGIRRRPNEVKTYQGYDSCDMFFGDMLHTVKEKGGTIISIFQSPEMLAQICSLARNRFERLQQITGHADIKCLLPEFPSFSLPFDHRVILQQHIGAASYFVYGSKYAIVLAEGNSAFRFIVLDSLNLAQSFRNHFIMLWELAPPIYAQMKIQGRTAST